MICLFWVKKSSDTYGSYGDNLRMRITAHEGCWLFAQTRKMSVHLSLCNEISKANKNHEISTQNLYKPNRYWYLFMFHPNQTIHEKTQNLLAIGTIWPCSSVASAAPSVAPPSYWRGRNTWEIQPGQEAIETKNIHGLVDKWLSIRARVKFFSRASKLVIIPSIGNADNGFVYISPTIGLMTIT